MRIALPTVALFIAALSYSAAEGENPLTFVENNYEDAGIWKIENHLELEAYRNFKDPHIRLGYVNPIGPNGGRQHSDSSDNKHDHPHEVEQDYDSGEFGSHDVHFSSELVKPHSWSQDELVYMDGSSEQLDYDVVLDASQEHKHREFSVLMPLVPEKNPSSSESSSSSLDSNSVDASSDSNSGEEHFHHSGEEHSHHSGEEHSHNSGEEHSHHSGEEHSHHSGEHSSHENSNDSHESHDFHHSQDQSLDEWEEINIENSEEECWRLWYSRSADLVWSNRLEKVDLRPIAFQPHTEGSHDESEHKIVKVVELEDYEHDLNRVNYIEIHSVNFFEEVLPDLFIVGLEDEFHPLEFKKPAVIVSLVRSDIEYTQKQVTRSLRGSAYINNAEFLDINRLDRLRFHQERENLRDNIVSILDKLEHFQDRIKVVERIHTSQFGVFTQDRDYDYLRYWVEESLRLKCEYFQDFYRRLRYSLPPSELARLFDGIFESDFHGPNAHHESEESSDSIDHHFIQNGFENDKYHGPQQPVTHTTSRNGEIVVAAQLPRRL